MNQKILIVEDNPVNMDIFEEIFEDEYEIKSVMNGHDALNVIESYHPALVLLDVMMPGIDGYEVCKKIREIESLKNVKIIMVSARAMDSEREKGMAVGADEYVTKPFDEDELLAVVKRYIS